MMKRHISFILITFMTIAMGMITSCVDRLPVEQQAVALDGSDLDTVRLSLDVTAMTASDLTRADDDATEDELEGTEAERYIDNIWVFQFDATTESLLITPRYYEVGASPTETDAASLDVLLKPDVESIIYVVANTGSSTWGSDVNDFATLKALKAQTIPTPMYKAVEIDSTAATTDLLLPMEGSTTATTTGEEIINVQVTRMYAKMELTIGDMPETLVHTATDVSNVPYYCQVTTLASAEDDYSTAATYPTDTWHWTSYTFKPDKRDADGNYTGKKMTLYLPENLQGCTNTAETDASYKSAVAPDYALKITYYANYVDYFTGEVKQSNRQFSVYPGANNYNDYNIKRNCIYKVKLNIYTDQQEDVRTPSSNCIVAKTGQTTSFLPYYRTETGGQTTALEAKQQYYYFEKYLNPDDDDLKIDSVAIIWQTKDCIGDNSAGDLVWIDDLSDVDNVEADREIHVRPKTKGNALIAAYNSEGTILWSWHIWVTNLEPDNVANAIAYTTYAWDADGIKTNQRVPGYALMACTLGATAWAPETAGVCDFDTYGMLYQWGRKDPLPPMKSPQNAGYLYSYTDITQPMTYYNNKTTQPETLANLDLYDNGDSFIYVVGDGSVNSAASNTVFKTVMANNVGGDDEEASLLYAIQHPTYFIATDKSSTSSGGNTNQINGADWLLEGDETLWGGLPITDDMMMWTYPYVDDPSPRINVDVYLYDNNGPEKTIFDPCPYGWRVSPGDLWLGFTIDGLDAEGSTTTANINCKDNIADIDPQNGFNMYLQGWHMGPTTFFPTQGSRITNGRPFWGAICGNYHNATSAGTTSQKSKTPVRYINRVNIIHFHSNSTTQVNIEPWERRVMYTSKATAGPIRCVRDHK